MGHGSESERRMPFNGWIWSGLAVAALVLGWQLWPAPAPTPSPPPPGTAPVDAVRAGTPPAAVRSAPASLPVMEVEPKEARIARFSTYESRFRADTRDPSWAPSAERTLVEAASEPALAQYGEPASFQAECLGRLCKVTMQFEAHGQAIDWAELYVLGMAGVSTSVQTMVSPLASGGAELIVYGARAGSEALLRVPARPASRDGLPVPE